MMKNTFVRIQSQEDIDSINISTRLLTQCAIDRGYAVTYCPASYEGQTGVMICRKAGVAEIRYKSTATVLTPSYGYFAAEDKVLTNSLLEEAKVPTPKTWETYPGELPHLNFDDYTYVVKPTMMNHGDGVSIGISDVDALRIAVDKAVKISGKKTAIIQQQVEGSEYRFLVVDGRVIAVSGREPASVVGDGVRTVQELIDSKNASPLRSSGHTSPLTKISIEDVVEENSKAFLNYIPEKNQKVRLLGTSNLSRGGEATDYTKAAHESLNMMAVAAAQATSLGIAGVDIITNDISEPKDSYVIEVNLAPGLRMHHFPSNGQENNVASAIFDVLERRANQQATIGVSSLIDFVSYKNLKDIPARIDTGARTSSLWVSDVTVKNGIVTFKLFGPGSPYYTGKVVRKKIHELRTVTSSTGHEQERFVVSLPIRMQGKKINTKFTLSDRSTQTYPILIGRNTLRGNFLVDSGDPGEARLYKYAEEATEFNENEAE